MMAKLKIYSGRVPKPTYLATPSYGLNRALGGGLLGGRIHVLWGEKASGKTTQALHMIASAQKENKICMFIDAEKTYTESWAIKCGVDVDKLKYIRGNSVEDILETIMPMITSEEIDVLVLDSLSSIFSKSFFDTKNPGNNAIGISARSANNFVATILAGLCLDTKVILIAHASYQATGYTMSLQAKLSESVKHWASTIIKFRQCKSEADIRFDGARRIEWEIQKSKQSVYPVKGSYYFDANRVYIDNVAEVVDIAIDIGLIEKSGAWYAYNDNKFHGEKQLLEFVRENDDVVASLMKSIDEFDATQQRVEIL
jgi:recombination protein RecA